MKSSQLELISTSRYVIIFEFLSGAIETWIGIFMLFFGSHIVSLYEHFEDAFVFGDSTLVLDRYLESLLPYLIEHRLYLSTVLLLVGLTKVVTGIGLVYNKVWANHLLTLLVTFMLPFDLVSYLIHPGWDKLFYILINLGIPGAKTSDLIKSELDTAIEDKPDYVTLLIGINNIHNLDSPSKFSTDFDFIVNKLSQTKAKIYVFNLPYLGSNQSVFFPYNLLLDYQTQAYNQKISQTCQKFKVICIDIYKKSRQIFYQGGGNYYAADLFHPSSQGYQVWGSMINMNK